MYVPHDMKPSAIIGARNSLKIVACSHPQCKKKFVADEGVAWVTVTHDELEEGEDPRRIYLFCSYKCLLDIFEDGGHT